MWLHSMAKSHFPQAAGGGLKIFLRRPHQRQTLYYFIIPPGFSLLFWFYFLKRIHFSSQIHQRFISFYFLCDWLHWDSSVAKQPSSSSRPTTSRLDHGALCLWSLYQLHLQPWPTRDWRIFLRVCPEISRAFYLHFSWFLSFFFPSRWRWPYCERKAKSKTPPTNRIHESIISQKILTKISQCTGQIESNYDEITDSFDAMELKSELLRGMWHLLSNGGIFLLYGGKFLTRFL